MKVEVKEAEVNKKEKKYPYLGFSFNLKQIVLFTEKGQGILLNPGGSSESIGTCSYQKGVLWYEECFEKFQGSITLSND